MAFLRRGLLLGTVLLLTACGSTAPQAAETTASPIAAPTTSGAANGFPVTVENCGLIFTYTAAPQRALAFDGNMIELMVQLGLADRLVGYWTSGVSLDSDVAAKLNAVEPISAEWPGPGKEVVLERSPDFVFAGWGYGFSEENGLTQAALSELQINSYALRESCPNKEARQAITIEDSYADMLNIGRIFGVEDRAQALVAAMQSEVAAVQAPIDSTTEQPRVFLYDDIGAESPLTAGRYGLPNHLIELAGGKNIFDDLEESWASVSWETVLERNPEVIIVIDTDWESAEDRIARLKSLPQLAGLPAIENERFVTVHYRQAVPGLHNAAAVRQLAQGLYPDRFQQ